MAQRVFRRFMKMDPDMVEDYVRPPPLIQKANARFVVILVQNL